jgi:murein DD-endopeptidase MepM/ murein hydrolase activator NlpD
MIRGRGTVVAVLVALLAVPVRTPAAADQAREDRIRELQEAIGEASAAEAAALRELDGIRARRAELTEALRQLDGRIADVEARHAALRADVERLAAAAREIDRRAARTRQRLETARSRARQSVAELYRAQSRGVPLELEVLEADSVHDAYAQTAYLSQVSNRRWSAVEELARLEEAIERLERRAREQRAAAERARDDAARERDVLAALRAEHDAQLHAVGQAEDRERALVASIQERKEGFTAELAALQVSSNAIGDLLLARQQGQPRADEFTVVRPVPGAVTSGFGMRVHPILGTSRMHNGVDMSAAHGSSIRAGAAGVVAWSGWRSGYGYTVIVDHGNQYATLYAHASALHVSEGETVDAGETVADVGATGLATAPHLHFEVRLLGVPVDPLDHM